MVPLLTWSEMCKNVSKEHQVTLSEIMLARSNRADKQMALLKENPNCSLISATLNIPGPVKTSPQLVTILEKMAKIIEKNISILGHKILYKKFLDLKTGPECYIIADFDPTILKENMISIEETELLGRLADIDVLVLRNSQLKILSRSDLGIPPRRCLICDKEAKICARSRNHSLEELHQKIEEIISHLGMLVD